MTAQAEKINPPPTNRGVQTSKVAHCIDWISATWKQEPPKFPDSWTKKSREIRPLNSYNTAEQFDDGRILLYHTTRPEMGFHVIMSGQTLKNLSDDGMSVLKWVMDSGGRPSRIDIAVDAFDCGLDPKRATNEIENKQHETRARKAPTWFDSSDGGWTQYIGRKESEVFGRVYNKAVEMGYGGEWTRVEVSYGGRKAQQAAGQVVRGDSIVGLIRGYVDFPLWDEWRAVMDAEPVSVSVPKKSGSTRTWLLSQVAPAIARCIDSGDDEIWLDLKKAVQAHLETITEF